MRSGYRLRTTYERFAEVEYTKKNVFKRRRMLMLSMPLHRPVTFEELPDLTNTLARAYAGLTDRPLLRDIKSLCDMELVIRVPSPNPYLANHYLLQRQMPRTKPTPTAETDELHS